MVAAVGAAIGQHAVVLQFEVRAVEFADLLVSAVHRLGNGDIALLHQVAVNGDGAEQILVMRAGRFAGEVMRPDFSQERIMALAALG